jgi:hypothetical protein
MMPVVHSRTGVLFLGLLLGGPHVLFLLLAVGNGMHFSWNVHVRAALFLTLAILAVSDCLFFGLFSVLLILWRLQSHVFIPDLKTARLVLSYTLMPVIYGLLSGLGFREWTGHYSLALFREALILYAVYLIGTTALTVQTNLVNRVKSQTVSGTDHNVRRNGKL